MRPARSVSKPASIVNRAQEALLAQGAGPTLVGKACGVSKMAASKWLRGVAVPDPEHAARIEEALGVSALWWRQAPTCHSEGLPGLPPAAGHEHARPRRAPPARPAPVSVRALPADWARRPGESRAELFSRRLDWQTSERMALEADLPPPALTSDVDREAVDRWSAVRIAEIARRRGDG